jgi:hypothetical protein
MKDFYDFETTPVDEDCTQVSKTENYMPAMKQEAYRMLEICKKLWPSLYWKVQSNPHDFGSYLSIRCYYDDEDEAQSKAFYDAEANWPATWAEAEQRSLAIV